MMESLALSIVKKMNSSVHGTPNGTATFVQDMSVNHCCGNVIVSEQFLDRADVVTVRKEMGCKAVPKAVAPDRFMDTGKSNRLFKGLSDTAFVQVVAPDFTGPRIFA